jgi:hypothetical protein
MFYHPFLSSPRQADFRTAFVFGFGPILGMSVIFSSGPQRAKILKMKVVNESRKKYLKSLKLSKFTPSTAQQSATNSDNQLKSYGQKTAFFGQNSIFGQTGQKKLFLGHNFLTVHRKWLPIAIYLAIYI